MAERRLDSWSHYFHAAAAAASLTLFPIPREPRPKSTVDLWQCRNTLLALATAAQAAARLKDDGARARARSLLHAGLGVLDSLLYVYFSLPPPPPNTYCLPLSPSNFDAISGSETADCGPRIRASQEIYAILLLYKMKVSLNGGQPQLV